MDKVTYELIDLAIEVLEALKELTIQSADLATSIRSPRKDVSTSMSSRIANNQHSDRNGDCQRFQVLVAGAGVAGCATALMLSDAGLIVAVVERSNRERPLLDLGESLTPVGLGDLRRLGLHGAESLFSRRTYGVQSVWGSEIVTTRSFIETVPGYGLCVDKPQMVNLLRDQIESLGIKIYFGCRLCIEGSNSDGSHLVSMSANGAKTEANVNILVDATGRTRAIARTKTDILHYDRLIATACRGMGLKRTAEDLSPDVSFTEAVRDGWWHTASSVRGQRIAIRFTDQHEAITKRLRKDSCFWDELFRTRWTSQLFTDAEQSSRVSIRSAATTALRRFAGPGWVAVGDAARTVDPLSSQGIHNGIRDSVQVAEAIRTSGAAPGAMVSLGEYLRESQEAYFRRRSEFYGLETRWPNESFWRLRKD